VEQRLDCPIQPTTALTDGPPDENAEWEFPITKSLFPSIWRSINDGWITVYCGFGFPVNH
jgi:hypothetical protein